MNKKDREEIRRKIRYNANIFDVVVLSLVISALVVILYHDLFWSSRLYPKDLPDITSARWEIKCEGEQIEQFRLICSNGNEAVYHTDKFKMSYIDEICGFQDFNSIMRYELVQECYQVLVRDNK